MGSVPKKFLDIVREDPCDSKCSRSHVDIIRFCFHSFEVYSSIDSSKMMGKSPAVSNLNRWLFLKTGSSVSNRRFFPDIGWDVGPPARTEVEEVAE